MQTTSLFIEIMIVGGETFVWIALLLMSIWDTSPEKTAKMLTNPILLSPILIFCYVLGIVMDNRIHEWFFRSKQEIIRAEIIRRRQHSMELSDDECKVRWREVRKADVTMPTDVTGVTTLTYIRHRIRIMRGSVGNIPLIVVFGSILLIKSGCGLVYPVLALFIGGGLTYECYKVWERIERSWSTLSYDWYEIRGSQQPQEKGHIT